MLIIKVENGQAVDHPMILDNFQQAFPDLDVNNLPANFAVFERVQPPQLGPYEKNQTVRYELVGNVYKDVWYCDQMSDEEKLNKQNFVKQEWASANGPQSWIFNELTCSYDPPISYPTDGKDYRWDETVVNWVEIAK